MRLSLTRFVGNAEYCYANSASMLLASIDEAVDPSLVESMTAVGAGARLRRRDGMIYFSILPPDIGLTRAFRALGLEVHEQAFEIGSAVPVEVLRAEVSHGPVLVGPLDAQHLTYLPGHGSLGGVDHYVLVTGFEEPDCVRLHDPKGYPNISLALGDLEAAWRATGIGYARGAFRYWSRPSRLEDVSQIQLVRRCADAYRAAYDWESEVPADNEIVGVEAFAAAASRLKNEAADRLAGMLVAFGLPVGARRAHDLAVLLQDEFVDLSAIKLRQSLSFVDGYRHLTDGDRRGAAKMITRIGELDEEFRRHLSTH